MVLGWCRGGIEEVYVGDVRVVLSWCRDGLRVMLWLCRSGVYTEL